MAIARLTPRTQVTTLAEVGINDHITLQPNTYYTCPTGKKARLIGTVVCRDRGAAASVSFEAAAVVLFTWDRATQYIAVGLPDVNYLTYPRALTTFAGGMIAKFEIDLAAGEFIRTLQNSGDNAEIDLNARVLELPA